MYGELASFDHLPTPFRCVATDLISGNGVVLDRGSLAKAMRATMAIPAIFTPVLWDDKLLVDGGLVQNLPVEVLQSMGADRTIAVRLQGARPEVKDLTSLTSIALRSVSVAIEQNERRSAASANVVIVVDTAKFSSVDYARSRDLIRAGYEAAKAKSQDLKVFELTADDWESYLAQRVSKLRHPVEPAPVESVTATDPSFRLNATHELSRKLGPSPVSLNDLEDTLSGIVAATGVPGASYRWDRQKQGYGIEFLERPGASILIRPSFVFSISPGEPSQAALRLSMSHIDARAYKARALASATIGYDPGLKAE
jgi:NTE family protein